MKFKGRLLETCQREVAPHFQWSAEKVPAAAAIPRHLPSTQLSTLEPQVNAITTLGSPGRLKQWLTSAPRTSSLSFSRCQTSHSETEPPTPARERFARQVACSPVMRRKVTATRGGQHPHTVHLHRHEHGGNTSSRRFAEVPRDLSTSLVPLVARCTPGCVFVAFTARALARTHWRLLPR